MGHCKAKGTAVGVWLPETLAVACYIIYADLDLMEHMCVCRRHSSEISQKVCAHQTPPMRGMQGPDQLIGKPYHSSMVYSAYGHMYTHSHACAHCIYTLWRHAVCTVCTQQCMHTDIRGSIILTLNSQHSSACSL